MFFRRFYFAPALLLFVSLTLIVPSSLFSAEPKSPVKWRALLVDIDDYKTLSELSYAVADVKLLRERLSQLDFASVTMLTTGARNDLLPDKENIEDSFNELVDSATETDCLFIMFSGRSYESDGKSWFAPTGARGPSSPERSININDLMTRLNPPAGIVVLQSCGADEQSWENKDYDRGFFRYFLDEALSGKADTDKDGEIMLTDVLKCVCKETSLAALRDNKTQTPFYNMGVGDFTIAYRGIVDDLTPEELAKGQELISEAEKAKADAARKADDAPKAPKTASSDWGQDSSLAAGTVKSLTLNGVEYKFHWRPAGTFRMGGDEYSDEKPIHQVELTRGFRMLETETTQKTWSSVMGSNPSWFSKEGGGSSKVSGSTDNYPVERVSWNDVQDYLAKLNSVSGLPSGARFRLPTEAEWEYACRAGRSADYSGSDSLSTVGWYEDNSGDRTHEVGSKQSNGWGLYDMSGNVWEWCDDWYDKSYYADNSAVDPKGPNSGSSRVERGGGWGRDASCCRCANRNYNDPENRNNNLGFRLVLDFGEDFGKSAE